MNLSRRLLFAALLATLVTGGAEGEDKKLQIIEGWGTVTDPLGDCSIESEGPKLIVKVPGGTHDLNPVVGGMDAPRVLQSVEGDFSIEVKVTGISTLVADPPRPTSAPSARAPSTAPVC
ncbi:MAG TPA: hypothetical protein VG826_35455 [Pirellulales bacterium]|nr:hypothetical protein [Pirellulales bacterium]